jgi:shikimate dehydrogenase
MRKYGLIGKSLSHSFSKTFFEGYFSTNNIEATYQNFEIQNEKELVDFLKEKKVDGCNVTIPYKQTIIPYLDELSEEAKVVGAVNTIRLENGRWIGNNTDVFGFKQSIKPFLTNRHEKALILGSGGAAKAVAYVLNEIGIEVLTVSRTLHGRNQFAYSDINEYMIKACKLIVNTTPVGMYPNVDESIEFPFSFLTLEHLVVDLIYNPEETVFLKNAKANHAMILNGASMLKEQALKSWDSWNK